MNDIIASAIAAAREAGTMLLENVDKVKTITVKGDRTLVTQLDTRAEKIVVAMIRSRFPGHGILCEEGSAAKDGEYIWVIDPLDGTHNYIRGIPNWGVSIGIVHKERFAAGIIYMPCDDEMYVSEQGSGAFKNEARIHVSKRRDLGECTLSYDSNIREDAELKTRVLRELGRRVFNIRMLGASTSLLTLIAEGKMDISVEFDDKPWDFCAGASLILEAGGAFTGFGGKAVSFRDSQYIASNGIVHDEVCRIVNAA
jgi:myo-inositol-1(or 4)-monophosphatase